MSCPCNPFDSSSSDDDYGDNGIHLSDYSINLGHSNTLIDINKCPSPTSLSNFTLEENYDPTNDYIRHYDRRQSNSKEGYTLLSPVSIDSMRKDASRILEEAEAVKLREIQINLDKVGDESKKMTPREITRNLEKYELIIAQESDIKRKKEFIEEYQKYKEALDASNQEDAEQAKDFLKAARARNYTLEKRLEFYQKALTFINKKEERVPIENEYNEFCNSLK